MAVNSPKIEEAVWPSGQRVGLAIPPWPLAGLVLGRPEFKSSAALVNSQLVASCQLGFLILLFFYLDYLFQSYLSGVPVN